MKALDRSLGAITAWAIVGIGIALVVSVLFALQAESLSAAASIVGAAVIVMAAAGITGGIIGFLFGIPRALTLDTTKSAENESSYAPNTNLEQISDWITKILVGLGLVQIGKLPSALASLSAALAPLLGNFTASGAFGVSLCIAMAGLGFVVGYLLARVRLPGLLSQADREAVKVVREEVRAALDKSTEANAQLLSMMDRVLTDAANPPTQEELDKAVEAATPDALVLAFNRAEGQRAASWRADKARMEKTIPIFRSLVNADKSRKFVRNFSSLGFALKDKTAPDYVEAIAMLSIAIEVRNNSGYTWSILEWNRAQARILNDKGFQASPKVPSDQQTRELILVDLANAGQQGVSNWMLNDPVLEAWSEVNEVSLKKAFGV